MVLETDALILMLYCVDLEVWSKLAKCVRIMRIASKCVHHFDCDWQRVNAFSHCIILIRPLFLQIISYSDTKVPVLVVMECKRANVIYVYELIFLPHTSRSTECSCKYKLPFSIYYVSGHILQDHLQAVYMTSFF